MFLSTSTEKVYKHLDENDVFEWGDIHFERQLKSLNFNIHKEHMDEISNIYGDDVQEKLFVDEEESNSFIEVKDMSFHDALFNENNNKNPADEMAKSESSILILGCGNSRLGEDILHYYLDSNAKKPPKVIQCDISTHVVNTMTKRYHKYIEKGQMSILQDDASQFTLIEDGSVDAIVDKGLVDALFCSDRGDMMQQVMSSAYRTLKIGKVFMFFSFSRPEYLLHHTRIPDHGQSGTSKGNAHRTKDDVRWSTVNVWELDNIFMYRFVKGANKIKHPSLKDRDQVRLKK